MATYLAAARLIQHIRDGKGPVLMHLRLGLLDAHSSSTDIKTYRKKEEIELTTAIKDPVKNFGRWLIEHGHLQEEDIDRIRKEIRAELERAEAVVVQEFGTDSPHGLRLMEVGGEQRVEARVEPKVGGAADGFGLAKARAIAGCRWVDGLVRGVARRMSDEGVRVGNLRARAVRLP